MSLGSRFYVWRQLRQILGKELLVKKCSKLSGYTHRMAVSNHRLTGFDGQRVNFRRRDYAHGSKQRVMKLDAVKFLSRFFLHGLPKGFVRIRRYGCSPIASANNCCLWHVPCSQPSVANR